MLRSHPSHLPQDTVRHVIQCPLYQDLQYYLPLVSLPGKSGERSLCYAAGTVTVSALAWLRGSPERHLPSSSSHGTEEPLEGIMCADTTLPSSNFLPLFPPFPYFLIAVLADALKCH